MSFTIGYKFSMSVNFTNYRPHFKGPNITENIWQIGISQVIWDSIPIWPIDNGFESLFFDKKKIQKI